MKTLSFSQKRDLLFALEKEDTIPLIVARPDIHQLILDTIKPFVKKWKGDG